MGISRLITFCFLYVALPIFGILLSFCNLPVVAVASGGLGHRGLWYLLRFNDWFWWLFFLVFIRTLFYCLFCFFDLYLKGVLCYCWCYYLVYMVGLGWCFFSLLLLEKRESLLPWGYKSWVLHMVIGSLVWNLIFLYFPIFFPHMLFVLLDD